MNRPPNRGGGHVARSRCAVGHASIRPHAGSLSSSFIPAGGLGKAQASAASGKLDAVAKRMEAMDQQAKTFGEMEKRVQALIDTASSTQQAAEKLMEPEGDFQKHRRQVREPLVEGLQAALFLGQLVRLVHQRLEVLAERIGPRRISARDTRLRIPSCSRTSSRSSAERNLPVMVSPVVRSTFNR